MGLPWQSGAEKGRGGMQAYIGIDCGRSWLKAVLYDAHGRRTAAIRVPIGSGPPRELFETVLTAFDCRPGLSAAVLVTSLEDPDQRAMLAAEFRRLFTRPHPRASLLTLGLDGRPRPLDERASALDPRAATVAAFAYARRHTPFADALLVEVGAATTRLGLLEGGELRRTHPGAPRLVFHPLGGDSRARWREAEVILGPDSIHPACWRCGAAGPAAADGNETVSVSDAACLLGRLPEGDRSRARAVTGAFGRHLAQPPDGAQPVELFARWILEAAEESLALALVRAALDFGGESPAWLEPSSRSATLTRALAPFRTMPVRPFLELRLQLLRPLVAVGGAAAILLPRPAVYLDTPLLLPPDHAFAAACGAVETLLAAR